LAASDRRAATSRMLPSRRRIVCLCLLSAVAVALIAITAGPSAASLVDRYQSGQQKESQLRSKITAENDRISGFEGSISSLQSRLDLVQRTVATQEQLLGAVTNDLAAARARLVRLRADYARDRAALATQLRAVYESPPPTIVNVVVDSRGFDELVNGLRDLTTVERHNVATTRAVAAARGAVQAQTVRLAAVQARRRRATAAVLAERDNIAQLKASIVSRELTVERSKNADTSTLSALHRRLVHEAAVLDAEAARAQTLSSGGAVAPPSGCTNGPLVPHGGSYGFFQSPGTNYSVNQEPIIAARLDQLGKALQLHLEGISGYRSPQHSVEVGGFADDPHTRGEASDTPGVEGVPESTLNQFCLTRPFPGAAEADHIQLS
jgi:peptidoglycan hydrolase CwlO-like protein